MAEFMCHNAGDVELGCPKLMQKANVSVQVKQTE